MKATNLHRKNLLPRMLGANKKQILLRSYSLKLRVGSINHILKNREGVVWAHNIIIKTRIADRKIECVCIRFYQVI